MSKPPPTTCGIQLSVALRVLKPLRWKRYEKRINQQVNKAALKLAKILLQGRGLEPRAFTPVTVYKISSDYKVR